MDKKYWSKYYSEQNNNLKPSAFARYILEIIPPKSERLIELGCGNGRDAVFFANEGFEVLAIDQVESEIKFLSYRYQQLDNLHLLCADFTDCLIKENFDVVYSRFTLHSISKKQQHKVLAWAYEILNPNGSLCIEVRGQKNELYKMGEPVECEPDAYILNDHFRRFINFDDLCAELKEIGFELTFAKEGKGFARYRGTNETFIRIVAKKVV